LPNGARPTESSTGEAARRLAVAALGALTLAAGPRITTRVAAWVEQSTAPIPRTTAEARPSVDAAPDGLARFRFERRDSRGGIVQALEVFVDEARRQIFDGEAFPDGISGFRRRWALAARSLPPHAATHGLLPRQLSVELAPGYAASLPAFSDRAQRWLLVGRFAGLDANPSRSRRALLSKQPGPRKGAGAPSFVVFEDLACPACLAEAERLDRSLAAGGGSREVRFFPLTGAHPGAFDAATVGAALARLSPTLFFRYERILTAWTTDEHPPYRKIGRQIAEQTGDASRFDAELASGEDAWRVVHDFETGYLAGVRTVPALFEDGVPVAPR
jgi:hypothetical protein